MKIFPVLKWYTSRVQTRFAPAFVTSILALSTLASCDMVNEDLLPCAKYPNTYLTVNFVYDFNMQNRDLFNEHAGTAHLYVFDEDGIFLFDKAVSRTMMSGNTVDFSMTFDNTYIETGKVYQLVAMAQGNHAGYEWSTIQTPGFQIPLENQMIPGVSRIEDYRIMLDRDNDSYADIGIVNYKDAYGDNKELMDTLWSTKPGQIQKVELPYIELKPQVEEFPVIHEEVTIPMMRITNALTVNLVHSSFNPDTDPDRFNILVDFPKGNGTIDFVGTTLPNRELYYRSLRKTVTTYQQKTTSMPYQGYAGSRADQEYAIQATFGLSRLQTTDDSALQVYNGETGELLFQIGGAGDESFAQKLANYFNTYDSDQDFLDKEYNFTVDIHMDDNYVWDWYQIGCEILGWAKREYNYTLH